MSFRAFRIHDDDDGYRGVVESLELDDLNEGEVTIQTAYSSVNYKDALAGTGKGKILRQHPLVGGIDIAGRVIASKDARFKEGDAVLTTGCGLSETRDGGYSEQQRLSADWVIPLPDGLSLKESMAIGTAGFTAALCLYRMECNGQSPSDGPIVITGATGGVGMLAIDIYTRAGYEVHAISGKVDRFDFLQDLGASQCVSRHDLHLGDRPLERGIWAGAVDNVGGEMLAQLTRVIKPWGNVSACGMAGGMKVATTVMPFIIRGIGLLGINSSGAPYSIRARLWERLSTELKPRHLDKIVTREVGLNGLGDVFETMLSGDSFGRTVVNLSP